MPFNPKTEYHRYRRYFVDIGHLYQKKEVAIYTEITLSLLTVAFFGFFALKPTAVTIASLIRELESKREIDRQLQVKINALAQAQTNFASVKDSLSLVDDALPTDPSLPQILYMLEILAKEEGLAIRSITVEPLTLIGKERKNPYQISFSLGLSGNFENLERFISSLERLRRITNFESLGLTESKIQEEKVINLNISAKTYFLPKEEK